MTEEIKVSPSKNGEEHAESAEEETELESGIIHQVEYYFSDVNLVRDKFLREQIKLDEGWVPLEVMVRFKRLAKLSSDFDAIATALNKSTSGLLEVSEDNKKVRRSPEMPLPEMNEERRKELQGRTVYAKGFPKDSELDDLLKYFSGHGDTENVIMRRYLDKKTKTKQFKGSVFVTFKTKEEAQKFVDSKELKYAEADLLTHWQDEYLQKKQEEYAEKKLKRDKKNKDPEAKEETAFKLPTGTVFHFKDAPDSITREDLKDGLVALGAEVSYVDYKRGDADGWVRFTKENSAIELFAKIADGKVKIGENDIIFRLLEGDEEKAYLDNTIEQMAKRRKNQKSFNKHYKGKHFKGNNRQGRKRKQEQHEDAPPSKAKTDS